MRQIAHSRIFHLSFEYTNPERAAWLMRNFMSNTIRKTKQTLLINLFMKLKNVKVGLKEVEDISEHMMSQQKAGEKTREDKYQLVKDFMKHKMTDAEKHLKQVTNDHKKSKEILSKVIREGTIVRKEFMDTVDIEVNKVWKDGKKKNDNKTNELVKKFVKEETLPEEHLGVYISDNKLDDIEKEMRDENDKPAIYAGIENNENNDKTANYAGIENDDKPANYAGIRMKTNQPSMLGLKE